MEPAESNVDNLMAFVGCGRQEAIKFLKRYTTVESAANAYLDNNGMLPAAEVGPQPSFQATLTEDKQVGGWDESPFQAEYGPMNKPASSFQIESETTLNPGIFSNAPTRPSSRTSQYVSNTPRNSETMAASHHSMGQELGVTSGGGNFRPATQEYYDNASWAMTIPSARETYANPDPEHRRRRPGVPAIMKPVSTTHYLSSLLTILHSIPMAKEALLARDTLLGDYGQGSDWWDGNAIRLSRVVMLDVPSESTDWQDIVYETQRVMAFLEQTERSYGSVFNLLQADGVHNGPSAEEGDFLQTWERAVSRLSPDSDLHRMFRTTAHNDPREVATGDEETSAIYQVQVTISERGQLLGPSLYEHLDELLWTTDAEGGEPKSIYMEPGEVLVFQAHSTNPDEAGLGVDVPAVLYADRYLKENLPVTRHMRKSRMEKFRLIKAASDRQRKLKEKVAHQGSNLLDAGELLDFVGSYLSEDSDKTGVIQQGPVPTDGTVEEGSFAYPEVARELEEVMKRIGDKLFALEDTKQRALADLRRLSDLFKQPSEEPALDAKHRYTLRGVSTDHHTTYVLANPYTTEDLIDTDISEWTWWKLKYDPAATTPVIHELVSEADVLEAAKNDARRALLVYASDRAVSYPTQPLASQLKNFVRADNLLFEREVQEHRSGAAASRRSSMVSHHAQMDDEDFLERKRLMQEGDAEQAMDLFDSMDYNVDPPPYEDLGVPQSPESLLLEAPEKSAVEGIEGSIVSEARHGYGTMN